MEKIKLLPIGIENFEKIRKMDSYYVDKTGLIKDLLDNFSEVTLFTRPRRFGKSLNMSMLRYFFETGTDPALFDGLEISKEKELCEKHLGRYPVISISLKAVEGDTYENAAEMLGCIINAEVMRHSYLADSEKLTRYEKEKYNELTKSSYSDAVLKNSLWVLSTLLSKHFNSKVIILIDEYDVPLARSYSNGYYRKMVLLIRNLFERTLKTNDNLFFSVLTGCMRIAKESIFTGLNNLKVQSISSRRFDEYFGFTDDEVKKILSSYNLENKHKEIKSWYDGYHFGSVSVYSPWDVLNYVDDLRTTLDLEPRNYWINTSSNDIIRRFLDKATATTKEEIEALIEGSSVEKRITEELTYDELDKSIDNLWSVLYTTGYLTTTGTLQNGEDKDFLSLKIPNEEIRAIFKEQIFSWFNDGVGADTARYSAFSEAFLSGDAATIERMFNDYLSDSISIRDTSVRKTMKENFYHGILLGILNFRTDWCIKSNSECGNGYGDILITHEKTRTGIIIEVKYAENDNLDSECGRAFRQIEQNKYTDIFRNSDVDEFYMYAVSCYKKHCRVQMRKENLKR